MRILVLGAGSIGGYFGGRLLKAGRDVTFLVRPQRAAQLAASGLVIRSACGDVHMRAPPTLTAGMLHAPFELVVLACKAYDLHAAMDSVAPGVGAETSILPLLNGMAHLDALAARFGAACVLGGVCLISSALAPDGSIVHLNDVHRLVFGERDGARSARAAAIEAALAGASFDVRRSDAILQEMWEKWILLAGIGGINCLMRGTIGEVAQAPNGSEFALAVLDEIVAVVRTVGAPPSDKFLTSAASVFTAKDSTTSSMYRDLQRGVHIGADQIIGDLVERAHAAGVKTPLLRLIYTNLCVYQHRLAV